VARFIVFGSFVTAKLDPGDVDYWATNELGVSQVWLSRTLGLSQPAISLSVARGRQIVSQKNYEISNL